MEVIYLISLCAPIVIWTFELEKYYDIATISFIVFIVMSIVKCLKAERESNNQQRHTYKDNQDINHEKKLHNYTSNNYENIETHQDTDRYIERKSHEMVSQIDSISTYKAYHQQSRGMSKGEKLINEILEEQGFLFEREYQFKEKYKGIDMDRYFFDFVIFNVTGDVIAAIEYQGEQHYNLVSIYHKKDSDLTSQKERDLIKKEFIESQRINYIEIPYYWGLDKEKISNYIKLQTIKRYT